MALERVKLECIEYQDNGKKKTKYGFCFSKNQKSAKIYTTDRSLYEGFLGSLERMCILTTFEEDYEIEKLIGKGSFGKVYLVKRKSDDKKFAAKMFFKDALLKQSRGKDALVNEIKTLRKLDHPGIMKLEKLYETMLGIFLIMELLEGGELFEHLKKKKTFTERDCAIMLMRVLDALSYMHQKNIVHRDIKPENLILRDRVDEYGIVIADFGLAQFLSEPAVYVKCGSPGYCAPEILNCSDSTITYDSKCDVFSVGCVFYHLIVGKNPFWSKYTKEAYSFNKTGVISFEDPKIKALSPSGQDLLQKMLCRYQDDRPNIVECLAHRFFKEALEAPKSPVLRFGRKAVQTIPLLPGRSEHELSGMKSPLSIDLGGEDTSFVFGRTNLIKGKIETLQDVSRAIKAREIKKGLLQMALNETGTPVVKSNSLAFIPAPGSHILPSKDESMSITEANLNESNEAGLHAQCEKPQEILMKITKISTYGIINNPFADGFCTEKDSSRHMRLGGSEVKKPSFLIVTSQAGLSTKSEEFPQFSKIQVRLSN